MAFAANHGAARSWAVCACFYTRNLYLPGLGHLVFENEDQFCRDYGHRLGPQRLSEAQALIAEEITRRRNRAADLAENALKIRFAYVQLHPSLFADPQSWMNRAVRFEESAVRKEFDGVYTLPHFVHSDLCARLLEELANFHRSRLPHQRPNSMNRRGVLLEELGLQALVDLMVRAVEPWAIKQLGPSLVDPTLGLDSVRAFTVEYHALVKELEEEEGGRADAAVDVDLATHFDNAELTLNIPLTEATSCEGSELYFQQGSTTRVVPMERGQAILHSGRLLHGVLPITSGSRTNLIIWMRSSGVRNQRCPMCTQPPQLEKVSHGTGDGFTMEEAPVCGLS